MYRKMDFLGLQIGMLTKDEMVEKIIELASSGNRNKFITYLNAHCVNVSFSDPHYRRILNAADLVYIGGKGIILASKLLNKDFPERVNILDFFDDLADKLKERRTRIYLLGTEHQTIERAALRLSAAPFCLNIVGFQHGFFNGTQERAVIEAINSVSPDILMVGMGVPRQEKWIHRHLNALDVKLCWAVGGAFEWLSGRRKRAPYLMVECGLEWVHRLLQQPGQLWKRYLVGNPLFIYRVLREKFTTENHAKE